MASEVTSPLAYLAVFGALLVLTGVTVAVAFVDLGVMNDVVAIGIAFFKASLVVWIFMNMRHGSPLSRLAAVGGLLWLAILFGLTMADYWSRGFLG